MVDFDKFMDDIERRQKEEEARKKALDEAQKSVEYLRERQRRHQEHPQGKTVWGK